MKRLLILLILAGAAAWGWHSYNGAWWPGAGETAATNQQGQGRGGRRARFGGEGPIPVIATPARFADVPVTADAVGTIQALNTVTVRSQVDGRLLEIAFKDGQDVRKGDVLAKIDPVTYQAQYDQALAKKAQDEALLANARADLDRYARLAQTDYGSRQQADTQRATVAQLEAQVRSDQAAIDNTKAVLDYTTIRAPIDGRLGIRLVDQGNLVRASDSNGLVVITQLKPIALLFNLPQQQLRAVSAALARGPVSVDALDADGTTVIDKGVVEVIDNVVDQTTGTIKVKARFPNERLQLWPGQFVNVRVFVDVLKQAIVAPTSAIQRGPNGAYVFAVNDDETVRQVAVTVGQQDEMTAVISSGVKPPEKLVTTGFARLTDKARVKVTTPEEAAQPPVAAPGRRGTREPGQGGRRPRDPAAGEANSPGASAPATDAPSAPAGEPRADRPRREGEGQGGRREGGRRNGEQGTPGQQPASPGGAEAPPPQARP